MTVSYFSVRYSLPLISLEHICRTTNQRDKKHVNCYTTQIQTDDIHLPANAMTFITTVNVIFIHLKKKIDSLQNLFNLKIQEL